MRTGLAAAALALSAMLTLAGCSGAASAAEESGDEAVVTTGVYGKIKEINGNEILLALGSYGDDAEAPQPDAEQASEADEVESEPPQRGSNGGGEMSGPPSGMEGGGGMSGPPSGMEGGGGMRGNRQQGSGGMPQGGQGMAQSGFTLTGEEESYLIPVTVPVTTGEGENMRELRFTQLAVKNIIRLNIGEDGNIVSLEVLQ